MIRFVNQIIRLLSCNNLFTCSTYHDARILEPDFDKMALIAPRMTTLLMYRVGRVEHRWIDRFLRGDAGRLFFNLDAKSMSAIDDLLANASISGDSSEAG